SADSTANQKPLQRSDDVCNTQGHAYQTRWIHPRTIERRKQPNDDQHWRGVENRHQFPKIRSVEKINAEIHILRIKVGESKETGGQKNVTNRGCDRDTFPEDTFVDSSDVEPSEKVVDAEYKQWRQQERRQCQQHHSTNASASISTSILGEIRRFTSTRVVVGRISPKNSP